MHIISGIWQHKCNRHSLKKKNKTFCEHFMRSVPRDASWKRHELHQFNDFRQDDLERLKKKKNWSRKNRKHYAKERRENPSSFLDEPAKQQHYEILFKVCHDWSPNQLVKKRKGIIKFSNTNSILLEQKGQKRTFKGKLKKKY